MKLSLMQLVVGLLIVVGVTIGTVKYFDKDTIVYQTEYQQEQLDSLTVAVQNMYLNKKDLLDSLSATTEAFQKRLAQSKDEISSLTRIKGNLNLALDSLRDKNDFDSISTVFLCKFGVRDTISAPGIVRYGKTDVDSALYGEMRQHISKTSFAAGDYHELLHVTRTFGDSLLSVFSSAGILRDSLVLKAPFITQLRPVHIDIATTVSKDRRRVTSLVTSPDFDSLHIRAFTTIKARKKFPWVWIAAGAGFVLGTVF